MRSAGWECWAAAGEGLSHKTQARLADPDNELADKTRPIFERPTERSGAGVAAEKLVAEVAGHGRNDALRLRERERRLVAHRVNIELIAVDIHRDRSGRQRNRIRERDFGQVAFEGGFEPHNLRSDTPGLEHQSQYMEIGDDDLVE